MAATTPGTRDQILSTIGEHAAELRALGVKSLALFGSRARGEESPDSDIDLVVELEPKTFDTFMDAKALLERLLGGRVDLVLADAVKPRLREAIVGQAVHVSGL